jgi:hypothetical protein
MGADGGSIINISSIVACIRWPEPCCTLTNLPLPPARPPHAKKLLGLAKPYPASNRGFSHLMTRGTNGKNRVSSATDRYRQADFPGLIPRWRPDSL